MRTISRTRTVGLTSWSAVVTFAGIGTRGDGRGGGRGCNGEGREARHRANETGAFSLVGRSEASHLRRKRKLRLKPRLCGGEAVGGGAVCLEQEVVRDELEGCRGITALRGRNERLDELRGCDGSGVYGTVQCAPVDRKQEASYFNIKKVSDMVPVFVAGFDAML